MFFIIFFFQSHPSTFNLLGIDLQAFCFSLSSQWGYLSLMFTSRGQRHYLGCNRSLIFSFFLN